MTVDDEFLRLFAFRTGIPCGYLLFFLFSAFWCIVAVVLLVVGVIRRRALLIALPTTFLFLAAAFVVGNVAYERALDLNPHVTDSEFVGTWRTARSILTLRPDGLYELHAGEDLAKDFRTSSSRGKWQRESTFGVRLVDASGKSLPVLRAITFRGRLHLIIEFDDPDAWDGDLGFSRRPK